VRLPATTQRRIVPEPSAAAPAQSPAPTGLRGDSVWPVGLVGQPSWAPHRLHLRSDSSSMEPVIHGESDLTDGFRQQSATDRVDSSSAPRRVRRPVTAASPGRLSRTAWSADLRRTVLRYLVPADRQPGHRGDLGPHPPWPRIAGRAHPVEPDSGSPGGRLSCEDRAAPSSPRHPPFTAGSLYGALFGEDGLIKSGSPVVLGPIARERG